MNREDLDFETAEFALTAQTLRWRSWRGGAEKPALWAVIFCSSAAALGAVAATERLPAPRVQPERGFFTNAFKLSIASATPGAAIWFSLDGTVPAPGRPGSFSYDSALFVSNTTTLRTRAYLGSNEFSGLATHTFIFPTATATQPARPPGFSTSWNFSTHYGMDPRVASKTPQGYGITEALLSLPSVSLVLPRDDLFGLPQGIYTHSTEKGPPWEREASVELLFPDGSPGFQQEAGLGVHGYTSRNHTSTLKHSLRIKFRARYGQSQLHFPMFADTARRKFDSLVLRACSSDSWTAGDAPPRWEARRGTYLRDQWMRDSMRDLGQLSSHGRYVHLWLDGLYWGLYNVCEALDPTFAAAYLGGNKSDYDVIKDYFIIDGGDRKAWDAAATLAKGGFATEAQFQRLLGNNPDGSRNPDWPVFLDITNYVDYLMVQITSGSQDWPLNNWWSCRRRDSSSRGFAFTVWDQEEGNNSLNLTANVFGQPFAAASEAGRFFTPGEYHAAYFYDILRRTSPSFRQFVLDRVWLAHTGSGALTPEANARRWRTRQNEIDHAIVAESARWGDAWDRLPAPFTREAHWLPEMEWVARYWGQNQSRVVERYRSVGLWPSLSPPTINRVGEAGGKGATLALSHTNRQGTIYYTLDGGDPRSTDGHPATGAIAFRTEVTLAASSRIRARVSDGVNWSPPAESAPPRLAGKLR